MNTSTHITCQLVPDDQRVSMTETLFGINFPMQLEPFIYFMADMICEDYDGGYWNFYMLSNGSFYMALHSASTFHVSCENGYQGELSAEAFGIVCTLYAYSHLSFGKGQFAETCADHFHRLREFMLGHVEAGAILRAID